MAITYIKRINNLQGYLIYASNPTKTQNGDLIFEHRCSLNFATLEFDEVAAKKKKSSSKSINEQPWIVIQSFKPHEIDPEDAHRLGQEFAKKYLGEGHQFIVMTHSDTNHIHNHIVFNHVNMDSLKCFDSKTENIIKKMRKASDTLCKENNLSIIKDPKRSGVSQKEFYARKQNSSYKARVEKLIDATIEKAENYKDFITLLKQDVEIDESGNTLKFKFPEQERWTRITRLHPNYSESNIKFKIEHKELVTKILKEARTSEDKKASIGLGESIITALYKDINIIENELYQLQESVKHLEVFRNSYEMLNDFKKADNKDVFKKLHVAEFKAYDAAKKAVSALRDSNGKLPKIETLKMRIDELLLKKEPLDKAIRLAEKNLPNKKNLNANIDRKKFKNYSDRYDILYNSDDPMESITALLRQGLLMRKHNIDSEEYKELEKAGMDHLNDLEKQSRALGREIESLEKVLVQEPIYRSSFELIDNYKKSDDKAAFKKEHFNEFKAYDLAKRTVFRHKDENGNLPDIDSIKSKVEKLKLERSAINSSCKEFRENLKSTGYIGIGLDIKNR